MKKRLFAAIALMALGALSGGAATAGSCNTWDTRGDSWGGGPAPQNGSGYVALGSGDTYVELVGGDSGGVPYNSRGEGNGWRGGVVQGEVDGGTLSFRASAFGPPNQEFPLGDPDPGLTVADAQKAQEGTGACVGSGEVAVQPVPGTDPY